MSYTKQTHVAGQKLTAAQLNYMENGIMTAQNVYNLLDNSDFRNPVNQRGGTSYTANEYTIDRWKLYGGVVSVVEGEYVMTTGQMYQLISGLDFDKTYTFAIENDAGIGVVCGKPSTLTQATIGNATIKIAAMDELAEVVIQPSDGYNTAGAYWAALYEGEYTAETLPAYVPKGYGAELAECQRYYWKTNAIFRSASNPIVAVLNIQFPQEMRITPTISYTLAEGVNPDGYNYSVDGASFYHAASMVFTFSEFSASADL